MKLEKRQIAIAINYGKYIVLLLLCSFVVGKYQEYEWVRMPIKNDQMEPKIKSSSQSGNTEDLSYIFIDPRSESCNNPQYDDIVRYEWARASYRGKDVPEVINLGRVIGLPGDKIRIKKGKVFRNEVEVTQDYVANHCEQDNYEEILVPKNHIYLLVDNRKAYVNRLGDYVRDSRHLGMIPIFLITGVVRE